MQLYVVLTRDPRHAGTSTPQFAVVTAPAGLDETQQARGRHASMVGREPVSRDVEVLLARWEVVADGRWMPPVQARESW